MKNTRKVLSMLALSLFVNFLNAFLISAEEVDKTMVTKIVEGNTSFALDLFEQIRSDGENLFFSPYSVSTALVMTYAGARGETEKQMMKAMHISLSQKIIHTGFSQLQQGLNKVQEKGKVEILIANSLWPHVDYPFRKEYLSLLEKNYKASITALDYANQTEKARQTINGWVEEKTKDRIKDLIKPGFLNELTRLVLANGIYFKGNWESQFKKEHTRNMPFHIKPSRTVSCPMMFQEGKFGYYSDAELQVLEMPYEGEELSLIVLLPMNQEGLARLEESLTDSKLKRWINELRDVRLQIFFPKFKTVSEFNLGEKLKSLTLSKMAFQ